jgi:cold-inducible RNA-binding protein
MSKRLYVGNLPPATTEDGLMQAFAAWSPASVTLPAQRGDRETSFGFVEIADDNQAALAITAMNGKEHDGHTLAVNEARPRTPRRAGGGSDTG